MANRYIRTNPTCLYCLGTTRYKINKAGEKKWYCSKACCYGQAKAMIQAILRAAQRCELLSQQRQ